MTDTTTPTGNAQTSVEEHENPSTGNAVEDNPTPVEKDEEDGSKGVRAEAARRRVQLREVEAERDALTERVQGFLRADAERIASAQLSQAADLFDIGNVQLADLLGEDGEVDPKLVEDAAEELIAARPGLAVPEPRRGPSRGGLGNYGSTAGSSGRTWAGELNG